jgi:formylglycine-generating enzyme required for sulfatase activity
MADIFISYSQQDRDRVKRLVDALSAEGYEVWWDLKIRAGESFDELIEGTLEKVSCVVGVWSRHSVRSEWVRAESAWAKDRGIFVSVRIDDEARLPLKFYNVHTASLADWDGSRDDPRFRRLVADIRAIAEPPRSPAQARGDASSPVLPEAPPVQEPSPAPTEKPTSPAQAPRSPKCKPQAAAARLAPKPRPHGLAVAMMLLAGVALIGVVIFFSIQDKPERDGEPVAPDVSPKKSALESEMVAIPAGKFQMGCVSGKGCYDYDDELPVRTVTFTKPFAIGKHEVTFAEYDRFAEATEREKPSDRGWDRGKRPVINVSWDDTQAYASWLSAQTGKRYRLPTEAEWEYATRGGTATPFSTGECINTDQANYDGDYGWQDCPKTGVYQAKTVEAGSLPANPWGLHEVHGNVWEWVQDCWHANYTGAPNDGTAWEASDGGDCGRRVVRGGSWFDVPEILRSAFRNRFDTDDRNVHLGFRLAQDL